MQAMQDTLETWSRASTFILTARPPGGAQRLESAYELTRLTRDMPTLSNVSKDKDAPHTGVITSAIP